MQAPNHWKGECEDKQIGQKVHGTVGQIGIANDDAVAGELGLPVLIDWVAAEYLCHDITENVAGDEEHDGPSRIFEFGTHAEKAEVEEQNRELVT